VPASSACYGAVSRSPEVGLAASAAANLDIPLWIWAATIAGLAVVIGIELTFAVRHRDRQVRLHEAAIWVIAVIMLAVAFGVAIGWLGHPEAAGQYFAGWITEWSLSLDNLFIFVLLIERSGVPRNLHNQVLLLGIVMTLLLRGILIVLGASALNRFSWILYVFGAVVAYTAARLAFSRGKAVTASDGPILRVVRRFVPTSPCSDGSALVTRVDGRLMATPVLVLIISIAVTDLAFALDSVPAIFALTREPYLIFAANIFALIGLRHLYFLIGGLMRRLVHLHAGLCAILGFIGVKLIAEALHGSGVHYLGPVPVPHISTGASMAIIGSVLAIVTVTSMLARRDGQAEPRSAHPDLGRGEGSVRTHSMTERGREEQSRA
jgi:tellurite resistance protein TerC